MTPHSKLCADIAKLLKGLGPECWFNRPVSQGYGRRGIPDFIGHYNGHAFAIEAKVKPDFVRSWQRRELEAFRKAGGRAYVVHGVEDGQLLVDKEWADLALFPGT